jgi:predicted nucleic acid-binding protein
VGVIIDTSIWVDVERGRLSPADVAAITGNEPVYLAPPVLAELEYGIHRAKTAGQRHRRAAAVARIRRKPCLVIDADTGRTFGRLAADLDAKGRPSAHKVQDLWLAALAVQHSLGLLTANTKDFDGIPGLTVLTLTGRTPR